MCVTVPHAVVMLHHSRVSMRESKKFFCLFCSFHHRQLVHVWNFHRISRTPPAVVFSVMLFQVLNDLVYNSDGIVEYRTIKTKLLKKYLPIHVVACIYTHIHIHNVLFFI